MIVGTASYDDLWADVTARAATREPPPGSKTVHEFAKLSGRSIHAARYFLNAEVQAGRMTADNYCVPTVGQGHVVRFYTPVTPAKKSITKHV